jgi:hypothetical protein
MTRPGYCRANAYLPRLILERVNDGRAVAVPKRCIVLQPDTLVIVGNACHQYPELPNNACFVGNIDSSHAVISETRPGVLKLRNTSRSHGIVVDGLRLSYGQSCVLEQASVITLEDESGFLFRMNSLEGCWDTS